ncbi:MAG: heme lyase CcmF/NrfE family subunit [Pseudomonadales bacterium]|jgi:cytochrome c-type biogenesis protein CcmF|nr:heme lyase CcmF/NrfE family subunit [Pseudomonadales bacterium]
MIPELGHFALILALCLGSLQAVLPLVGAQTGNVQWMQLCRPLSAGLWVFMVLGFGCLAYAFLHDDFSVAYVAHNSNSLLPVYYKFAAVWGAHEGSLLLWVLILATWGYAVSLLSRELPLDILARVMSVMALITVGFLIFLLATSNPFERLLLNTPAEGVDLNPLLQDFGLIVHPPFLYMGYVGFSVAFAFAIAALLTGRLDAAWARWTRPWTNAAWAFLTIGIALGSWWAYYELGWGSWWFWDPTENVSFMPWLVGTALIHSLAVTEKRGVFKSWTILLAIAAFSLSLLGAFIVRSGLITSVHAFAVDPKRGMVLLTLLLLIIGGSLFLYALRAPVVKGTSTYGGYSREIFLLINNILLVVSTAMILLGTLFPLIHEAIYGEANRVSVGPPYFNTLFLPLMALLAFMLGVSTFSRWKRTALDHLTKNLWKLLLASVALGIVLPLLVSARFAPGAMLAIALALWILFGVAQDLWQKTANKASRLSGLRSLSLSYYGMQVAHAGLAVIILGICLTSHYSIEEDRRMAPGDSLSIGSYEFVFKGVEERKGPNYVANSGNIDVLRNGVPYLTLHPEKRRYLARGDVQTEVAIEVGFFRDLFTALGDPRGDGAWVVRIHVKPFVFWIWLGAFLMAAGGVTAILDRRYRKKLVHAGVMPTSDAQDMQGVLDH